MKIYHHKNKKLFNKATIKDFDRHWTNGISRRDFVKSSLVVSLLASIAGCKPTGNDAQKTQNLTPSDSAELPKKETLINQSKEVVEIKNLTFSEKQHKDLLSVYMHLFPDDGDGPSAKDLNVLTYLEWAMTDDKNKADGDPEFIIKGIGWLNQFANDAHKKDFIDLDNNIQHELISKTAQSEAGENWLSILVYYLIEALTLDPYYGGNPDQIGWQWLEHKGGFPHPVDGKTYKDFD